MGGLSGSGTWTVPICSHMIASSSPAAVAGVGGRSGVVGVGYPSVLDADRPCRILMSFISSSACRFARASRFTPGVAIVVSGTSVMDWVSVAALGCVFPRPSDWMAVLCLDARLPVEGGRWLGSSRNPGSCSLYYSGTRGLSRNPGPCSLKCSYWRLLSLGLSVRDVVVGRAGGSVRSGASPRCSIVRSLELAVGDVGGAAVGARLSPRHFVEGVGNLEKRDKALLTWLPSPRSGVVADGVAT